MADGTIKIPIDIDDNNARETIKNLEDDVRDLENVITQTDSKKMTNLAESMTETADTVDNLKSKLEQLNSDETRIKVNIDEIKELGDFTTVDDKGQEISALQDYNNKLQQTRDKQVEIKTELSEQINLQDTQVRNANLFFDKTAKIKDKINEANTEKIPKDLAKGSVEASKLDSNMKRASKSSGDFSKGVTKGVRSLTKTALALFSIRTIYGAISKLGRQAINSTEEWAVSARGVFSTFSDGLSNALAPVIKSISNMLLTLMGYINAITQAFFGITLFSGKTSNNIGSSVGGAKKLNKELKKMTASFDTAEVVSSQLDDNLGGAGGGGGASIPPIEIPTPDLSKFKKVFDDLLIALQPFIDTIKSIDLTPLKDSLKNLGNVAKKSLGILGNSFKRVMNNTIAPFIKLLTEDIVPKGLNTVAKVLDRLNPIVDKLLKNVIEPLFNWFMLDFVPTGLEMVYSIFDGLSGILTVVIAGFETFWSSGVGRTFAFIAGEGILAIMQQIGDIFDIIADSVDNFFIKLEEGDPIAQALAWSIGLIVSGLVAWKVAQMALNIVTAMFKAISPFGWIVIAISAVIAIVLVLYNYWDEIVEFFINTIEKISNFFKDLGKKINEVFQNVKQSIIDKFNEAKQSLVDTWNGVANWFNTKVIQPVANFFSNMWQNMKDGASNAWQGIKNIFSTVASYFGNIFGNAWNNVKNIFSTGGQIFMGIVDGITNAFKSIVNAIIGGINRVVSIPFNAINNALSGLRRVSILGAKPFGWLPSIGVPKIPRLAKGGVLRQPTLNLAGEYAGARTNPEIVAPQKLLDERIALGLENLGNVGNNQPVTIINKTYLDGKQVAESVNEYNESKDFNVNGGLVWNT